MKKLFIITATLIFFMTGFISCSNSEVASFYIENATDCKVENIIVTWTDFKGNLNDVSISSLDSGKCSKYYAVLFNYSGKAYFDDRVVPFTIKYDICGETYDEKDSDTVRIDEDGNCHDDKAVFIEYETTLIKISRDSYRIYSDD